MHSDQALGAWRLMRADARPAATGACRRRPASLRWCEGVSMDDLLREFLTETSESLDRVDSELVRFEREPNNGSILGNIFRLVHTVKGTCGFLGLPRLEALAHAAETLMAQVPRRHAGHRRGRDAHSRHDRPHQKHSRPARGQRTRAGRRRPRSDRATRPHGRSEETVAPATAHEPSHAAAADCGRRAARVQPRAREQAKAPAVERETQPGARADEERGDRFAGHSIRVNVETLDHLMTTVSELVLTRNQLLEIVRRHEDSDFKVPLQRLSNVTAELQEGVMKTRMQPIGNAWQKLPRIVRDLAAELGKQIELEMHGADTELDRQVLELIKDPLTHLVRNCADHGIETPRARRAAGKPEQGTIRLTACHEGGHIIIEIADDGRGLDFERIRAEALQQRPGQRSRARRQ